MFKKIIYFVIGIVIFSLLYITNSFGQKFKGIDVSHHNNLNWNNIPNDIHFCYIKLSEGTSFVDPKYKYHTAGCRKNYLSIGYYHYFRTDKSGKQQFEHFKTLLDSSDYSLIPVIDVEYNTFDAQGIKNFEEMYNCFYKYYGYYPLIYYGNYKAFFKTHHITKKSKYWIRGISGFTIYQQLTPITINNCKVDVNYCNDVWDFEIEKPH